VAIGVFSRSSAQEQIAMSDRPRLNDLDAAWLSDSLDDNPRQKSLRSWLTREETAFFFSAMDHAGDLDHDAAVMARAPRARS
jgi:hypothetical protein